MHNADEQPPEHAEYVRQEREQFDYNLARAFDIGGLCCEMRTLVGGAPTDIATIGLYPGRMEPPERPWSHYSYMKARVRGITSFEDQLSPVIDRFLLTLFRDAAVLWGKREPLGEWISIPSEYLYGATATIYWGDGPRLCPRGADGVVRGERRRLPLRARPQPPAPR
jgi:hypothetical protein